MKTKMPMFVGWVRTDELLRVRAAMARSINESLYTTVHSHPAMDREPMHALVASDSAPMQLAMDHLHPGVFIGGYGQRFCLPPIPMVLHCPECHHQHVDKPEPASGWTNPPHKSHLCAACKFVWRPCDFATTGVQAIRTRGEHDTARTV